jgi:hypothetical protein
MNYKILNKVLEELKKDKPDLSYIRGMVETLLSFDNQGADTNTKKVETNRVTVPYIPGGNVVTDAGRVPSLDHISEIVKNGVTIG